MKTTAVPTPIDSGAFGFSDLTDGRLRRPLRRYARLAALALRGSEAHAIVGSRSDPLLVASFGTQTGDGTAVPEAIRSATLVGGMDENPARGQVLGAAMQSGGGDRHGTLWVLDSGPRRWSRRDVRILRELAAAAAEDLTLRMSLAGASGAASLPLDSAESGTLSAANLLGRTDEPHLLAALRDSILAAVHAGRAEAGTRLPSIREVAERVGATRYAVLRAYRALESEGVVETRHRSGVYVASLGETPLAHLPETARWLSRVLTESYLHQLKLPTLPSLIERWTSSSDIRCACIESSEDYRYALGEEVRMKFGLEPLQIAIPHLPFGASSSHPLGPDVERMLAAADVALTTPFHAPRVGRVAEKLGIPLIIATLDDGSVSISPRRLSDGEELVLICADTSFADRILAGLPNASRSRFRIIAADATPALNELDPSQPVLMTGAAKQILAGRDFRLLAAHFPAFSKRFADRLSRLILQLNLQDLRAGGPRPGRP